MTCASLTRIADFQQRPFDVAPLDQKDWETGDYAVGEVTAVSRSTRLELTTGRMTEVAVGDSIVGALGVRAATLEAVGSWQDVQDDQAMQVMTAAGLLGRVTSQSTFMTPPIDVVYRGHVMRSKQKLRMRDFVQPPVSPAAAIDCPVLLLIGTSMSSGKTTTAQVIIRRLKKMGLRVAGAKLTGAGRYHDILAMFDAGATRSSISWMPVCPPPFVTSRPFVPRLANCFVASQKSNQTCWSPKLVLRRWNLTTVTSHSTKSTI